MKDEKAAQFIHCHANKSEIKTKSGRQHCDLVTNNEESKSNNEEPMTQTNDTQKKSIFNKFRDTTILDKRYKKSSRHR